MKALEKQMKALEDSLGHCGDAGTKHPRTPTDDPVHTDDEPHSKRQKVKS